MSTPEVTPDMLRAVAAAWEGGTASDDYARHELRARANHMEHQMRPLPTVPGWYPTVVVERGGESCTGALLNSDKAWVTALLVDYSNYHDPDDREVTVRWAEQDGKTPGQTLLEAMNARPGPNPWPHLSDKAKGYWQNLANAVLAVHGTPTLTPVGEHPEPDTRGLLPVRFVSEWGWIDIDTGRQVRLLGPYVHTIVADPRPAVSDE